jgi:DnaJ-class molecular chaperone
MSMADEEFEDFYGLLRVPPSAPDSEIKRAYRHEIGYWHPDKYAGRDQTLVEQAQQMTIRLNRANEVLANPAVRQKYDELYREWIEVKDGPAVFGGGWDREFGLQGDWMALLKRRGVEVIDKRARGGCLWVVGGQELSSVFREIAARGRVFNFSKRGGKATRYRPAWFTR